MCDSEEQRRRLNLWWDRCVVQGRPLCPNKFGSMRLYHYNMVIYRYMRRYPHVRIDGYAHDTALDVAIMHFTAELNSHDK